MDFTPNSIDKESRKNEETAEKRLRKMGFCVDRLDKQGPRSRPEFLVSDHRRPIFICEVKTIFSAGYLHDRGCHVSMADTRFLNAGGTTLSLDFRKINDCLAGAVKKQKILVHDCPEYDDLPLLVFFFFDFFADILNYYPVDLPDFPEVSGLAKIIDDVARNEALERESMEKLEERIRRRSNRGLPPNTKDLALVENASAGIRLPRSFVDCCFTDRKRWTN